MRQKTPGENLREARVKKGLSLYDVESKSGIEAQYLLAIEMDQLKVLPKEIQKKAFSQYAKLVDLDAEHLYQEQQLLTKQVMETTLVEQVESDRDIEAKKILSRFSKHKREEKRKSAYVPLIILSTISLIIILSVGYIIYRHVSNQPQVINSASFSTVDHVSDSQADSLSHSVSEVSVSGVNVTRTVQGQVMSLELSNTDQPVKLVISLKENNSETWYSVADRKNGIGQLLSKNGQQSFEVVLDKDTRSSLITLAHSSQVTLAINGEPLDLSELRDHALSYITVTVK